MTSQSPMPLTNWEIQSRRNPGFRRSRLYVRRPRRRWLVHGAGHAGLVGARAAACGRIRFRAPELDPVALVHAPETSVVIERIGVASHVHRNRQRRDVARCRQDADPQRGRVAPESGRSDPGRVDLARAARLQVRQAAVGRSGVERQEQRPLGERGDLVERGADAHAHDQRRARARRGRSDRCRERTRGRRPSPSAGASIPTRDALSEPPPLSITWTVAPDPGAGRPRRTPACCPRCWSRSRRASRTTLMRRCAEEKAARTAASTCAWRSPERHSSAPSSTRTHTVPVSWHSGDSLVGGELRVLDELFEDGAPPRRALGLDRAPERVQHVGAKLDRGARDGVAHRRRDLLGADHAYDRRPSESRASATVAAEARRAPSSSSASGISRNRPHARASERRGHRDVHVLDAVLARQQHAARHHLPGIAEDGAGHAHDRGGRSVVGRTALEQRDDLGTAVDGAVDERVDSSCVEALGQGAVADGRLARQRHHRVAVGAGHERVDGADGGAGLLGDGVGEARRVEHPAHADDARRGEARDLPGEVGHDVERVGDAEQNGARVRHRRRARRPSGRSRS